MSMRPPASSPPRDGAGRDESAAGTTDAPVTLDQLLARREARVRQRQRLHEHHGGALVQLTLVTPGPVKNTPTTQRLFDRALPAVRDAIAQAGWRVAVELTGHHATGPEALLAVTGAPPDAVELKRRMVALEDGHALGRLVDADCYGADGSPVSRRALGLPPRRCLVCGEPAHACSRSRAHPLDELQRAIEVIVDGAAA